MKITNLEPKNAKAIAILAVVAFLILMVYIFLKKTFGGISAAIGAVGNVFGLNDTPAQAAAKTAVAAAKTQSASIASPWSPSYYQNAPAGALLVNQATADAICGQIWDSVGIFTSSMSDVIAAIKELTAKSQLSFVAYRFNALYQKDLLSWLTLQYTVMGTPDDDFQTLLDYVNSMTNY